MKHIFGMLLFALPLCLLAGCDESDDSDGYRFEYPAPAFDTSTELGTIQKELYDDYGVYCTPTFTDTFFTFDWSDTFDSYTHVDVVEGDYTYTVSFLKELKKTLDAMPSFTTAKLPSYVLLVDSLRNEYDIYKKNGDLSTTAVRGINGCNQTNFMVLGFAGKSFAEQDINEMRETWAALALERALDGYTAPEEFSSLVEEQMYGKITGYTLTGRWTTSWSMSQYGFLEEPYLRITGTNYADLGYTGKLSTVYYLSNMTSTQDMALFMAFTMFRPAEGKAETYAISDLYEQKETLMKDYCQDELGFELKLITVE